MVAHRHITATSQSLRSSNRAGPVARSPVTRIRKFVLLPVIVGVLLSGAQAAAASVRLEGGETPFYARIERDEIFHTDKWAVVVFYRPVACVRSAFNLLDFFDVPAAFGCGPPTVDGFQIWRNGPAIDPAPIQSKLRGLGAVPVWFVSWPELQAAIADDVLTIGEFAALPSLLVGSASFFTETLHPEQAAQNGKLAFVARGLLGDGRSFAAQASLSHAAGRITHVRIGFGV